MTSYRTLCGRPNARSQRKQYDDTIQNTARPGENAFFALNNAFSKIRRITSYFAYLLKKKNMTAIKKHTGANT